MEGYIFVVGTERRGPYAIGDAIRLHQYTPSAKILEHPSGKELTLNELKQRFTVYDMYKDLSGPSTKSESPEKPKVITLYTIRANTQYADGRRLLMVYYWFVMSLATIVVITGDVMGIMALVALYKVTDKVGMDLLLLGITGNVLYGGIAYYGSKLFYHLGQAFFDLVDRSLLSKD